MNWRRIAKWAGAIAAIPFALAAMLGTALAYPQPFFPYHAAEGRLELYSDRPFDTAKAEALLDTVDTRLRRSPLDHGEKHRIFITNTEWRRRLFFNTASGAAGVNFYPLTRNVFLRHADAASNRLYGASGRPTAPPRTLTYYMVHEITHSLTGEERGLAHLWNYRLPVWIREGYADYVGLGGPGSIDVPAYYRRYRAHDPHFAVGSGFYDRYRMLAAFFLDREHWGVAQLLSSNMTIDQAQAAMDADMAKRG